MMGPYGLQIRHPKRITLRQTHGINGATDKIDDGLISGQIAIGGPREGNSLLDDDIRIHLDGFTELIFLQGAAVLLGEPKDHLVADEDAELLVEFEVGLGEAAGDGHDGAAVDAFGRERAHDRLQVGRQAEGDGFGVVEEGLAVGHGGDELGAPDVAAGAADGEFVRVAVVHVHDVGHERERCELVRELAAEEPEVGKGRVDLLEVL